MMNMLRSFWHTINTSIFVGERYEKNVRQMISVDIIVVFLGISFTLINYIQRDKAGGYSSLLFALSALFSLYFLVIRKSRTGSVVISIITVLIIMTYDVAVSPNGFSYQWTLLIPPTLSFFTGILEGMMVSVYLQALLIIVFYTPFRNMVEEYYPEIVMNRFPFLYFFNMIMTLYIMYTYHKRILEDIEREKSLNDEVKMHSYASQAKSDFLANMSHEIRTPIHAILGMDEMLLREIDDELLRQYAQNIRRAGRLLLFQINDVLDLSKIEAGKMEIFPEEYSISAIIEDMRIMMEPKAAEKGLDFSIDMDKSLPCVLYGDSARLRQILLNLLSNAVKYTNSGSITMTIRSIPVSVDDELDLYVEIKDTGSGIKPEDIRHLLTRYERIEDMATHNIEGTGLGMNIVISLLRLMGSTLSINSEYGKGSTFSFEVRQKIIDRTTVEEAEALSLESDRNRAGYHALFTAPDIKLLLVDDTEMNILVTKGLLKNTLIQIDTASNGKEGLELSRANEYDLLLIDHRMPVMDGMEMMTRIRMDESNPNTNKPCIILTANNMSGFRDEALSSGFDDFLVKPIGGTDLEQALYQYLPKDKLMEADDNALTPASDEHSDNDLDRLRSEGIIDVDEGLEYAGGQEMYLAALKLFADTAEARITEIEGYRSSKDWKNYMTKVHALKSSARIIGAGELSESARSLELAAGGSDHDYIEENTAPVMDMYRRLASRLKGA